MRVRRGASGRAWAMRGFGSSSVRSVRRGQARRRITEGHRQADGPFPRRPGAMRATLAGRRGGHAVGSRVWCGAGAVCAAGCQPAGLGVRCARLPSCERVDGHGWVGDDRWRTACLLSAPRSGTPTLRLETAAGDNDPWRTRGGPTVDPRSGHSATLGRGGIAPISANQTLRSAFQKRTWRPSSNSVRNGWWRAVSLLPIWSILEQTRLLG